MERNGTSATQPASVKAPQQMRAPVTTVQATKFYPQVRPPMPVPPPSIRPQVYIQEAHNYMPARPAAPPHQQALMNDDDPSRPAAPPQELTPRNEVREVAQLVGVSALNADDSAVLVAGDPTEPHVLRDVSDEVWEACKKMMEKSTFFGTLAKVQKMRDLNYPRIRSELARAIHLWAHEAPPYSEVPSGELFWAFLVAKLYMQRGSLELELRGTKPPFLRETSKKFLFDLIKRHDPGSTAPPDTTVSTPAQHRRAMQLARDEAVEMLHQWVSHKWHVMTDKQRKSDEGFTQRTAALRLELRQTREMLAFAEMEKNLFMQRAAEAPVGYYVPRDAVAQVEEPPEAVNGFQLVGDDTPSRPPAKGSRGGRPPKKARTE